MGDHDYKHDGYGDYKDHVAYAKSYKHEPEYKEYEEPHGKYDDEYGYDKYDHKHTYKLKKYEPAYEIEHHDDYGYEHKYDHKPSYYSHKYKRSVYGYGDDSYSKSYSSYKPYSYRHKRSVDSVRIGQKVGPDGIAREGQQNQGSICESNAQFVCTLPFTYDGRTFTGCTRYGSFWNRPWCSLNGDYDGKWYTCIDSC